MLRDIAWLLLLIPFGIVLGTGLFFIFCVWQKACGARKNERPTVGFPSGTKGFNLAIFEQPTRWLAVKIGNPAHVQAALNLRQPTPCSWEEGLMEARDDKLFISPPISGWVMVVGAGLPAPFDDVDDFFQFITGLSRKLGQVQYFSASRVVNQHAWVLMERGIVYRAYAWAGQTLWNQGPVTAAEKDLEMRCFDYGGEENYFAVKDDVAANIERIAQLAARWSVDPGTLSGLSRQGQGIVGALQSSHSR